MPPTTYQEAQRLASELAPLLARIPRARGIDEKKPRSERRKTTRDCTSAACYGAIGIHIRHWLDTPVALRPKSGDFAIAHGIVHTTFASAVTKEQRLRRDPAARAARDLHERAARTLLRLHPRSTRRQRARFAAAHGLDLRTFLHALRRVEIMAALERAAAPEQKGLAA